MLVSWGRHQQMPPAGWRRTSEMYSATALGARRAEARCWQGWSVLASLRFWGSPGSLVWLLSLARLHAACSLRLSQSPSPFSQKAQGYPTLKGLP